ncbi:MAG: glycosyltransferase family 9 protein [Elusimicrobiota bacterium]
MKRTLDFLIGSPLIFLFSFFKKSPIKKNNFKKILIIKLAAVGDAILLAPAIKTLKEKFPEAEIDWLISPSNSQIVKAITPVHHVIVVKVNHLLNILKTIFDLRSKGYDLVIDFEQWSRGSVLMAYFSGIPERIGFNTQGQHRSGLFTDSIPKRFDQHEIENFMDLVRIKAPHALTPSLELHEDLFSKNLLEEVVLDLKSNKKNKLNILIHPGCGFDGTPREWPLENYAVFINWVHKNKSAQFFLTSGPEEIIKVKKLMKLIQYKAVDLGGKLGWLQMLSLVKKMDLVISGNTGVMHLAAALQIPQIALHGPTNPVIWGPKNSRSKTLVSSCPACPCLKLGFEYHALDQSCMKQLSIEDVKASFAELIDNNVSI